MRRWKRPKGKLGIVLGVLSLIAVQGPVWVFSQDNAAEQFREIPAGELEAAKGRLRQRLDALKERLARDPAEVREGWLRFLHADLIEQQLEGTKINRDAERKIRERIRSGKPGMEFSPVAALRHAWLDYLDVRTIASSREPAKAFDTLQAKIREDLAAYQTSASPFVAAEIGQGIRLLRRAGQAPQLVSTIDQRFGHDNLVVQASRRLVAAGIEQPVDETSAISDSMLGVDIQGVARMTGQVSLAFSPSQENAGLELMLSGHAFSNSTGRKRKVAVMSTGTTSIQARKSLWIDDAGLHGSPAVAACATNSSIDGVCAPCALIERVAWKKAQQSQGQAESLASSKAETRIEHRVDEQAAEMLTKANESFQEKFRRPLLRRDGLPKSLRFSTTADKLLVNWLHRDLNDLAADTPAPPFSGQGDLAVRVHQSYVSNLSAAAIGGVKLTDERLAEMLKEATGEVPEELQIDEDKDAWSITFAEKAPFSLVISDDGLITVTVEGDAFTRNDTQFDNNLRMSATYKFEKTATGSKLIRQGDVQVDFVAQRAGLQVGIKPFMRRKFEALFKPEIVLEGIKLPGRWEKAGKLQVIDFVAAKQWISMAWDLVPSPPAPPQGGTTN